MAAPALGLLWILAAAAQPAQAAPMGDPEPAQQEELTLLFHGALQLGQALNSVYKATEAKLTEAGHSLGLYSHILGLVAQEVSQGQAGAQELHRNLSDMQTEEDTLQLHVELTAQALGQVTQEQQVLRDSVQKLEGRLRGAWLGQAWQEFEALKVRGRVHAWFSGRMLACHVGDLGSIPSPCTQIRKKKKRKRAPSPDGSRP
ncbi:angiopoietin-like protein 8 isoform X1 [Tamandua tetradactyla]|uniref:angiopoietin-like protein 8 isoform X1 n=1 Tax=Tamandua tetradactyla TaxID=48850 RepID=UPI004053B96E